MMKHHGYLFVFLMLTLIIIGLLSGGLVLDFGNKNYDNYDQGYDQNHDTSDYEVSFATGDLINVTGIVLTSPDKQNWEKWKKYANASESFFHGWLYSLTKKEAKDLFKSMARRGVDVKMVMENKQYQDFTNSWEKVLEDLSGYANLQIKSDAHLGLNFNHTKTFVNDRYSIIQSANLTQSAFATNTEHFFVTDNPIIRDNLATLFDKDRNDEAILPADIQANLLVCPIDCRAKIEYMIEHAQHSIYVYHQYLTDPALTSLINQKIADGLDVHFILSDTDSNYLLVRDWGKDVVSIQKKPYVHTKLIIVDKEYAIIGSMNLSSNALDNNREIGIIVKDKGLIDRLVKGF